MNAEVSGKSIIVFDGVCNLCNAAVNFIILRDDNDKFTFASIQSATGQRMLAEQGISRDNVETFLLVENGRAFIKSDAALNVAKALKRPWRYLYILCVIPKPIRDYCYTLIARNRYKWFGKRARCMVPSPTVSNKFLK